MSPSIWAARTAVGHLGLDQNSPAFFLHLRLATAILRDDHETEERMRRQILDVVLGETRAPKKKRRA
jgi:hypothetical protein